MTKDELLASAEAYKNGEIEAGMLALDVDAYSAALLQQTPCSTLRELLAQLQISERKLEQDAATKGQVEKSGDHWDNRLAIQKVLKLIDDMPPVA